MPRRKANTPDILDDPLYRAHYELCVERIKALELWRIFQEVDTDEGTALELGGVRRLVMVDGNLESRFLDFDTGQWRKHPTVIAASMPDMSLRGGLQNPTNMGAAVLKASGDWALGHVMRNFDKKLPDLPPESDHNHDRSEEQIRRSDARAALGRRVRSFMLSSTKSHYQRTNWLAYTKAVWTKIDRDALSLLLLARFRKSFGLSEYLRNLDQVPMLRRLAAVDRVLMPWAAMLMPATQDKAVQLIEQGLPLPRKYTAYTNFQSFDDVFGGSVGAGGSVAHPATKSFGNTKTVEVEPVDWRELKGQPFSFMHAMCGLDCHYHAPFLAAWKAQPTSLRKRTAWIIQNAEHGYAQNDWNLAEVPTQLWTPLIQLMLEQGAREQRERGYGIVVSRAWRNDFFSRVKTIADHWSDDKSRPPPARRLSDTEMVQFLPAGPFRALYEHQMLEASTAATETPVRARTGMRL